MLILTRRINETLVIGEDVFLTVLGVKGNQVRIGIAAPKDVTVHREEIFVKIKAQQEALNAGRGWLGISLMNDFQSQKITARCQLTH